MIAYPGRSFGQLYHRFVKGNALVKGSIDFGDRTIELTNITAPVLVFGGATDGIAPIPAVKASSRCSPAPPRCGSRSCRAGTSGCSPAAAPAAPRGGSWTSGSTSGRPTARRPDQAAAAKKAGREEGSGEEGRRQEGAGEEAAGRQEGAGPRDDRRQPEAPLRLGRVPLALAAAPDASDGARPCSDRLETTGYTAPASLRASLRACPHDACRAASGSATARDRWPPAPSGPCPG